eukprot:SAG31_NODE_28_length_32713_cov_39.100509_19_plen_352_part_00
MQGAETESSGGGRGISPDAIAIVLSVLVGAAGYVIQAYTARRAERAQQQQAQELHTAEQARQREHQMATAQIERTHRALDQCCRPVLNELYAVSFARVCMVGEIVGMLEISHPDVVKEMMGFANAVLTVRQPDGTVTSSNSGALRWTPTPPPELTRAMGEYLSAQPTAAASVIANHDVWVCMSSPYAFEMPTAIFGIIAAEPTGEVAEMYRDYVRHTMMPLVRRVEDTLRQHAAYLALPPKDWLVKTFAEISWRSYSKSVFDQHWLAYMVSFERLLSEWSENDFKSYRPANVQSLGGLIRVLTWSQERAEVNQAELIGMTSVAEVDSQTFSHQATRLGARHGSSFDIEPTM